MHESEIATAWHKVFPQSRMSVVYVMRGAFYTGYLANDSSEVANGIWLNDPLSYRATIEGQDWVELDLGLFTRPAPGSYLAFDRVKMRKKTIKNVTHEKLVARFTAIKAWLIIHHHNIKDPLFSLDEKLTSTSI